jgi:Kef-type K+ transport system membrane component KefB
LDIFVFATIFMIIALASNQIGELFRKAHLPLISGFLFTGIVAGPYLLNLISLDAVEHLRFVDGFALAFIAFAAGNELYIRELRGFFNRIRWVTVGLVLSTFTLGSTAFFLLSDQIPFMHHMPVAHRVAVAVLGGAILIARSPSSAIAVVTELRAKGPFTSTALGVTVIMDVLVITVFAVNSAVADALLTDLGFDFRFLLLLFTEILLSLLFGVALGKIIEIILSLSIKRPLKTGMVLLCG